MVELVIRFYKNGDSAMERVIYADECWIADPEVFKVNREEAHSDHAFMRRRSRSMGLICRLDRALTEHGNFRMQMCLIRG